MSLRTLLKLVAFALSTYIITLLVILVGVALFHD